MVSKQGFHPLMDPRGKPIWGESETTPGARRIVGYDGKDVELPGMLAINPPWDEDEDEEPPTPEKYSVPNEKGVVAQHIETQDEAESIALHWTNKTDEDFVAFEMIYTMPDGSRRWASCAQTRGR